MSTVLNTTLAIALFLACVVIHEWAHAYALRQLGGQIKAFGVGLPLAPRIKLKPTARRPYSISISPWLVGAYVQARDEDEERIKNLSYWDQAWFSGAGVVANLVIGALLTAVVLTVEGKPFLALYWVAGAVAVWLLRRAFTALVMPIIALGILALVAYITIKTTAQIVSDTGTPQMSGLLGVGELLTVSSPLDALKVATLMSLSLGLFNMLPLVPVDGGRIVGDLVRRWWGEKASTAYTAASVVLVLGLVVYVQILDVVILSNR